MYRLSMIFLFLLLMAGCMDEKQDYTLVSMHKAAKQAVGQSKKVSEWLYGFDVLREYKVGPFKCYIPDSGEESHFFCLNKEKMIFNQSGNSISIPITKKTTLMLKDNNKDGEYDLLNYDIKDKNGNVSGIVFDLNLDGRADWKVVFNKGVEVFVNGEWVGAKGTENLKNGQRVFHITQGANSKDIVWDGQKYIID